MAALPASDELLGEGSLVMQLHLSTDYWHQDGIATSVLPASQHLPAYGGVPQSFVGKAALCNEASILSSLWQ